MISLGELSIALKSLREESGYKQSEICEKTGINQPTLSNIESGRNFNIESFLVLYNFYCESFDSNTVITKLFKVKDAYTEVIIQKLRIVSEKNITEMNKIIRSLE